MARLRIIVVAQETDGDVYALATCKFYTRARPRPPGSSTSGTPFAGNLYAAISGGSPISTTQALSSSGTLTVWTDSKSRVDVGIEAGQRRDRVRAAVRGRRVRPCRRGDADRHRDADQQDAGDADPQRDRADRDGAAGRAGVHRPRPLPRGRVRPRRHEPPARRRAGGVERRLRQLQRLPHAGRHPRRRSTC